MTVTITVPDSVVKKATAHGMSVSSYVEMLVGEAERESILPGTKIPTKEELDHSLEVLASLGKHLPPMPNEAFSRASIYEQEE